MNGMCGIDGGSPLQGWLQSRVLVTQAVGLGWDRPPLRGWQMHADLKVCASPAVPDRKIRAADLKTGGPRYTAPTCQCRSRVSGQ